MASLVHGSTRTMLIHIDTIGHEHRRALRPRYVALFFVAANGVKDIKEPDGNPPAFFYQASAGIPKGRCPLAYSPLLRSDNLNSEKRLKIRRNEPVAGSFFRQRFYRFF